MKTYPKNTYKVLGWKPKDNEFSLIGFFDNHMAAKYAAMSYTLESQEATRIISLGQIVNEWTYDDLKGA